ncbi:M20/M25/M40 family metallo-hydrolase [Saccharothrix variisporea]|uniref:Acetylornithine deacetylase/succinyl-diaminopimelate desuccinylase-like protein n=1 Tax=Saccharothrix variisporea TaxID=543527 RepID=A0A495X6X9_9PSEU|nr:M20/M25/M40 family metallo-hydrolase [Saccharothrix variisporea]RKT69299.1 acetylornithine deacetylase/succinyl-diaminopimelate desuccinylase-like protein [Saccharothrix variisporea]
MTPPTTELLGSLAELVSLDTVSPMPPRALDRCETFFARFGARRVREGVFVVGDTASPTWLYTHVDTKPAEPLAQWRTDPWRLTPVDDTLVGLGVSDSKFQLLTALAVADPQRHCVVIDTCEETDGCADAAALIEEHRPRTLVVCDGSSRDGHDVFNGMVGQVDGFLTLDTGAPRSHPARSTCDVLGLLSGLAGEVAELPGRFTVTGIVAEDSVRSLSLQSVDVRFDWRFPGPAAEHVDRFLVRRPHRLRHSVLHPVWGRRTVVLDAGCSPDPAPFSSRFGGARWTPPERCVVVAGGLPDNRNHQPNEFVRVGQIEHYRRRLAQVLALLGEERGAER